MESFAKISLGQTILKLVDRVLWVVEKSAQWSLPVQEASSDENGKTFGEVELVRPLPWILFLPGLILLRAVRIAINVGAFICGYPQIQPSGIVKYIQKRRRQLRTIKNNGLKSMRARKEITAEVPAPTEENPTTESADSTHRNDSKRKFVEVEASSTDDDDGSESEEETLTSQIERLAFENSIDDPDFNPDELSSSDATDTSFEDEVSITEAKDLVADAKTDLTHIKIQISEQAENKEEAIPNEKSKTEETTQNPVT